MVKNRIHNVLIYLITESLREPMSFMWMLNVMTSNVTMLPSFETQTPGFICTDQNYGDWVFGRNENIQSYVCDHLKFNSNQEEILVK